MAEELTTIDVALFQADYQRHALKGLIEKAEQNDARVLASVIDNGGRGIERRGKYLAAIDSAVEKIEEIEAAFARYERHFPSL